MKIVKSIRVNAPADKVWDLLGPNYVRAGDWASGVYVSSARPGVPEVSGAPCVGRVCETSLGPFTERITDYNPAARSLAYQATGDKMPGFVRSLVNRWSLTPLGPGETEVRMEMNADLAPLMGWMMRLQFNKVLQESIEEFKHFAETGKPHPRKQKVDSTKKAIAARQAAMA